MENYEFRKGAIRAGDCINEGLNFIKARYWLFFAMVIVQLVVLIAANAVPYIGSIINIVVSGALTCGIYIALLAQRRGKNVPFSLMFEGFSRIFQTTLITLISLIPFFVYGIITYFFISIPKIQPDPQNPTEIFNAIFNRSVIIPFVIGYSIVLLLSLIISVLLFFALPLIADHNLSSGEAIKLSVAAALGNTGGLILLLLFEFSLSIAGALVCGVGIFFVLPIIDAANIVAYQSVFPDSQLPNSHESPHPENYNDSY